MSTDRIRVLGIAPYQSLKSSMETAAASYDQIQLTTYVGNLDVGAELAKQYMNDGFDIIISRGGTASLIKTFSPIPVIDIPLSVYDILITLRLTAASTEDCAIIGFPSITTPARMLCDLLQYDIKVYTIHDKNEVAPMLSQIKEANCNFVLCDVIAESLARQAGLNPILIVSGPESIKSAFDEALQIGFSYYELLRRCTIMEHALKNRPANTIVLKEDGSVFFSNYTSDNITAVMEYLKSLVKKPQKASFTRAFHLIDDSLYAVTAQNIEFHGSHVFLFYIEPNPIPSGSSKYGLHYTNYEDTVYLYSSSFYSLTSSARLLENQIHQLAQINQPLMILGESGTGKNQVARRLYIESPKKNHPYIIIDCPLVNEKNWSFLTKHYNSPLFDKGNTIYISNIQALPSIKQQQLLSLLLDTNTCNSNRLIFSCSQTLKEGSADPSGAFINYLTCATLFLPPLRELTEDIPSSASLYLNSLNVDLSRQVIGFEPEALRLLCNYHWPDNFMQLKKVLADLVLLTTGQYVKAETVSNILAKEARQYAPQIADSFNYDRPLSEMLHDIVKTVLAKCDGNQTKAAKQLGIGRTTLWRYLNET